MTRTARVLIVLLVAASQEVKGDCGAFLVQIVESVGRRVIDLLKMKVSWWFLGDQSTVAKFVI